MFKVSFKENPKFPVKKVQRFNDGKVTIVTLEGVMELPKFTRYFIPDEVWDWMNTCKNVQAEVTMTKMHLTIKGKAKKADGDIDNPILGERIAEARAKISLYKFMSNFCQLLFSYYSTILYDDVVLPEEIYSGSMFETMYKYQTLYNRECEHLDNLLAHESDTKGSSQS